MKPKFMEKNPWSDADVEAHWDRVADIYVDENDRVQETHVQRFAETIRWLDVFPGARVLNVTSRDCELEDYVRNACPEAEITHAEISAGLMAVASRLRPRVRQQKIETYSRLPFPDRSFDRLASLETLEHVAEPLVFLRELARVAARPARLVLSCPPATSEWPYRFYTRFFGGHGEGPHRFLPSREVKALLAAAGWSLVHHEGTLLIPVGPRSLQQFGERMIQLFSRSWIAEWGIRQFYVAEVD